MDQTWFLVALIPPLLYAFTNHIDKVLLEKYFKEGGVGTLILFSSLLSILALPFIYLGDQTVLNVSRSNFFILSGIALLDVVLLWCYLEALKDDESAVVIVFYQLVPVLGLVLGYYILGETITERQLLAMCIIIAGTTIISFKMDGAGSLAFRRKTVVCMGIACLAWATESTIFKAVALEENVWRSLFWKHLMLVIVGVVIFGCIPAYRRHFTRALRNNSRTILSFNVLNEVLYMTGNIVVGFAVMLAPVALVLLAETFQAIFVFTLAIMLLKFFPRVAVEQHATRDVPQKLIAIAVTGVGTWLLLAK